MGAVDAGEAGGGWCAIRRELKAYIEAELRDYHQTKAELEEARENLLNASQPPPNDMPRGGEKSDPTPARAIRLMTNRRIKYMEQVVRGIEIVLGELDEDKMRLVELKYWQRPRQLTDAGIAMELHVDKSTIYRWTNAICYAIGIELGVIDEVNCKKDATFKG